MVRTRIAIVGYGNIGKGVHEAIAKNSDMELVGIITRRPEQVNRELMNNFEVPIFNIKHESKWMLKKDIDVAILCGGSKNDLPKQGPYFAKYFNTVDSFDTHTKIPKYFNKMNKIAKDFNNVSIISAGWDPGTFSLERVLADAFIPGVKPYGFYGLGEKGGLSMGHSDALRTIKGVKDARQYTHAIPEAMKKVRKGENPELKPCHMHWRECFIVLEKDTSEERTRVEKEIITMPNYYEPYHTIVKSVTQKEFDEKYRDPKQHDGIVIAVGTTGKGNPAKIEYRNEWQSNPEATASILIACARAAYRLNKNNMFGAYTMLDIPPAYFNLRSRDELLLKFM